MAKKYLFPKNNFKEQLNEIYFESLEKTKKSKEYIANSMQINLYRKILKNNYNVPEEKIEEFFSLIQTQTELEYENAIQDIKYFIDK